MSVSRIAANVSSSLEIGVGRVVCASGSLFGAVMRVWPNMARTAVSMCDVPSLVLTLETSPGHLRSKAGDKNAGSGRSPQGSLLDTSVQTAALSRRDGPGRIGRRQRQEASASRQRPRLRHRCRACSGGHCPGRMPRTPSGLERGEFDSLVNTICTIWPTT